MSEIQITDIKQIELEISFYKEQAAQNIIEIGQRLLKAKELVPHGEWGRWLMEKVEFSSQTANKFMKIAIEMPNISMSRNLSSSKIYELLSLPLEDRETFIEENPVENMTTRELRQAIKDKKKLEQKVKDLENRPVETVEIEKVVEIIPPDYENLKGFQQRHADMCYENTKLEGEIQRLKRQLENKNLSSNELEKLRKELSSKSEEIFDLKKEIKQIVEVDSQVVYEKKLKDTALIFCTRVHTFLNDTGGLAWLTDYIDELDDYDKRSYVKALELMEGWVMTVKSNINKGENLNE